MNKNEMDTLQPQSQPQTIELGITKAEQTSVKELLRVWNKLVDKYEKDFKNIVIHKSLNEVISLFKGGYIERFKERENSLYKHFNIVYKDKDEFIPREIHFNRTVLRNPRLHEVIELQIAHLDKCIEDNKDDKKLVNELTKIIKELKLFSLSIHVRSVQDERQSLLPNNFLVNLRRQILWGLALQGFILTLPIPMMSLVLLAVKPWFDKMLNDQTSYLMSEFTWYIDIPLAILAIPYLLTFGLVGMVVMSIYDGIASLFQKNDSSFDLDKFEQLIDADDNEINEEQSSSVDKAKSALASNSIFGDKTTAANEEVSNEEEKCNDFSPKPAIGTE